MRDETRGILKRNNLKAQNAGVAQRHGLLFLAAFALGCSSSESSLTDSQGGSRSGDGSAGSGVASGVSGSGAQAAAGASAAGSTSSLGGASGASAAGASAAGASAAGASAASAGANAASGAGGTNGAAGTGNPAGTSGANAAGSPASASGGSGPIAAPVRDTASKVPISSAPGYTVEGNYAYGPLTAQRLDVIYPTGAGPKGTQVLPVVLMFHGGAWIHSYTNNYGSGKDHMSTFFSRFLKHGFMVCNAEYRVNDKTADGAPAPAAVEDALLAAKWCFEHLDYFHGDKSRFVVTGASAGGHLALMVGLTTPAAMLGPTSPKDFKVAAIVDGYGPADIEAEINAVAAGWIPTTLPNRAAIAKQVSPITYVRADAPPMICVQGQDDNTAPVRDSTKLVNLLKAAGADASIQLVPGGHGFTTDTWPAAEKDMFDWLVAKGIGK